VGGNRSGAAKVVRVASEALAEVPGPDAIDDDAGGQRVLFVDNPIGESETSFPFVSGKFNGFHSAERFSGAKGSGGDGIANCVNIAAREDHARGWPQVECDL